MIKGLALGKLKTIYRGNSLNKIEFISNETMETINLMDGDKEFDIVFSEIYNFNTSKKEYKYSVIFKKNKNEKEIFKFKSVKKINVYSTNGKIVTIDSKNQNINFEIVR